MVAAGCVDLGGGFINVFSPIEYLISDRPPAVRGLLLVGPAALVNCVLPPAENLQGSVNNLKAHGQRHSPAEIEVRRI